MLLSSTQTDGKRFDKKLVISEWFCWLDINLAQNSTQKSHGNWMSSLSNGIVIDEEILLVSDKATMKTIIYSELEKAILSVRNFI